MPHCFFNMSGHGGVRSGAGRPTLKRTADRSAEELAIEAEVLERKRQREAEDAADFARLEAVRAKAKKEREEKAAAEKKVWRRKTLTARKPQTRP